MNNAFTAFLVQISIKYTGVKCHYYVFQHTRVLWHFYGSVVIMRLLSAVLFLLNIAYHDTCVPIGSCPLVRLGQMGQMLRRNGNVFSDASH